MLADKINQLRSGLDELQSNNGGDNLAVIHQLNHRLIAIDQPIHFFHVSFVIFYQFALK